MEEAEQQDGGTLLLRPAKLAEDLNGEDAAAEAALTELFTITEHRQDCEHLKRVELVEALLRLLLSQEDQQHRRTRATQVFCRLEPWSDETIRNLVLRRHIAQLYNYARDYGVIFRKFEESFTLPEHIPGDIVVVDATSTVTPMKAKVFTKLCDISTFFWIEVTLLSFLSHKNIITCYGGAYVDNRPRYFRPRYCILMEEMEMNLRELIGQLKQDRTLFMDEEGGIEWLKFNLYKQMIKGIGYLHQFHICHRDIKPANIMVKRREQPARGWELKLIDVGVSRAIEEGKSLTWPVGTLHYTPPEVLRELHPGGRAEARLEGDIYSLGCVIDDLWFEKVRPSREKEEDVVNVPQPPRALRALIDQCVKLDSENRPTSEQAFMWVCKVEAEWRPAPGVDPHPVIRHYRLVNTLHFPAHVRALAADVERQHLVVTTSHDVRVMDSTASQLIHKWDMPSPGRVAVSRRTGEIFVTNRLGVQVFDGQGRPLRQLGSCGRGPLPFPPPGVAVAPDGGQVFINDMPGKQVLVFDAQGRSQNAFGRGQLTEPSNIAVDPTSGNVLVLDQGFDKSVKVFTPDGRFIRHIGSYVHGERRGELLFPITIACDSQGNVLVGDLKQMCLKFDAEGSFVLTIGQPGQFQEPVVAAADPARVYVADGSSLFLFEGTS